MKPPNKHRLNDLYVSRLQPRSTPFLVWDLKQHCLVVQVQPTGHRAFKVIYSIRGRSRWYQIGNAAAINVATARRLALKVMAQVADGKDPAADRVASRHATSFEDLVSRYLKHAKTVNKSWQQADRLIQRHVLPRWSKLQAADITRSDVKLLISKIAAPVVANQTLVAASAIFSWAIKEEAAGVKVNPCIGVTKNKTSSRERVLADSEIPKFWRLFDDAGLIHSRALRMILLTGQRPGEVAHMRTQHIQDGWWLLPGKPVQALAWPGTKNGNSHRVWLPKPAQDILTELEPDGFVFPNSRGNGPVNELDKAMRATASNWELNERPRMICVGPMVRLLLFAMLGSDNRDEVANAAAKMKDILKNAGLGLHDLWQLGWNKNKDELAALLAALFTNDIDVLLKIGQERASYFYNDAVFADVVVRGHRNTYPVESKAFAQWLLHQFFLEKQKAPASSAIKTAVRTLAANAEFGPETPRYTVHLRTAEVDGRICVDLCDDLWRCVEVDENGWRVIGAPALVRFRRAPGMRALPVPQRGGSLDMLREFVNLNDSGFVLFVAVFLDAFRSGKHPILNLVGEFAAAKSTLAKLFKQLIDPDVTELRSLPGTPREIFIAVNSARVRAWDNVSRIERVISDALCQLSDGSGFGTRKLYTDDDEFRIQGSRSIILTGLTNCVTRPDLSSRTIMLLLQPIKDNARKSEVEFWTRFKEAYPFILGALLDALAHGLKQLPNIQLYSKSRMADFELFGHACEGAYTTAGSFAAALAANATDLNETLIEDDPVAKAITAFMLKRTEWSGTTTALLDELTDRDRTEQRVSKQKDWPKDATRFGGRVRAVAATLRKVGIDVTHGKAPDRIKTRTITLRKIDIGRSDATDAEKRPLRGVR